MKHYGFAMALVIGLNGVASAQEPPRLELVLQMKNPTGQLGSGRGALSDDGKLAVTVYGKEAILWDCATGRKVRSFQGHTDAIGRVAISADGNHLVTGSQDKTAILWDLTSGKKLQTFREPSDVVSVALSADGKRVVTGSSRKAILWDAESGVKLHTFEGAVSWEMAISVDGKHVVTAPEGAGPAFLWDATTGKKLQTFDTAHRCVAMSRDGKYLVSKEPDGKAALRETQTGKVVHRFEAHKYTIWHVALSADGKVALTGAFLWNAQTGKAVRTLRGHFNSITSVALSGDGGRALTVCGENTAFLWDTASGKKLQTFQEYADDVAAVALSGDGRSLAVAGPGVHLWNLADGKKTGTFRGQNVYFRTVALSGDGKRIIAGSTNEEAILWDAESGKQLRTYPGIDAYFGPRVCVAITADAQRVAVLGLDAVDLWDTARGNKLGTVARPDRALAQPQWYMPFTSGTFALSSDGKLFVYGEIGKAASLWDAASGKKLQSFEGHPDRVYRVALSGDGKLVLTGSRTAILWDAASGKKLHTFAGGAAGVALSADGKVAVTGSGAKASLWDTANGDKLRDFRGDMHDIVDLTLSGDGKHLWTIFKDRASGFWNTYMGQSIRLWDTATGKERCRLYSLNLGADWLVVTPDGRFDGSPGALRFVAYREPGTLKLFDDDATLKRFHRPGLLAQVWKSGRLISN